MRVKRFNEVKKYNIFGQKVVRYEIDDYLQLYDNKIVRVIDIMKDRLPAPAYICVDDENVNDIVTPDEIVRKLKKHEIAAIKYNL